MSLFAQKGVVESVRSTQAASSCVYTLTLHHSALVKKAASESRKEPEKKTTPKQLTGEPRSSHLSQAHLLLGAVKRRRYACKVNIWTVWTEKRR